MRIFGHEFKEMSESDWQAFAGAEPGTLICYLDEHSEVLFWEPAGMTLSVCSYDPYGSGEFEQTDYKVTSILKIS